MSSILGKLEMSHRNLTDASSQGTAIGQAWLLINCVQRKPKKIQERKYKPATGNWKVTENW